MEESGIKADEQVKENIETLPVKDAVKAKKADAAELTKKYKTKDVTFKTEVADDDSGLVTLTVSKKEKSGREHTVKVLITKDESDEQQVKDALAFFDSLPPEPVFVEVSREDAFKEAGLEVRELPPTE